MQQQSMSFWSWFRIRSVEDAVREVLSEFAEMGERHDEVTRQRDEALNNYASACAYIRRLHDEFRAIATDTRTLIADYEGAQARLDHLEVSLGSIRERHTGAVLAKANLEDRLGRIETRMAPRQIAPEPQPALNGNAPQEAAAA